MATLVTMALGQERIAKAREPFTLTNSYGAPSVPESSENPKEWPMYDILQLTTMALLTKTSRETGRGHQIRNQPDDPIFKW